MKRIFTISCVLMSTLTFAQCFTAPCTTATPVPITDINAVNNTQGSKCITNPQNNTQTVPPFNLNGNWEYVTFKAGTGTLNVQTIINTGGGPKKVYSIGNVNLQGQISMDGGNNSADTIFVSGNTNISTLIANNTFNYIMLDQGSTLTIGGVPYLVGMTYQNGGNNTNTVQIITCSGTPLSVVFEKFYNKSNRLFWVTRNSDNFPVEIEHSFDKNQQYWKTVWISYNPNGSMIMTDPGFYRARVNGKLSTTIEYNMDYTVPKKNDVLYNYMGQKIKGVKVNEPYIYNGTLQEVIH